MLTDHWPLFGLRLRTPRLELRVPDLDALLFPVLPDPDVGHVLHVGEHDVVARFQIERVRGDV